MGLKNGVSKSIVTIILILSPNIFADSTKTGVPDQLPEMFGGTVIGPQLTTSAIETNKNEVPHPRSMSSLLLTDPSNVPPSNSLTTPTSEDTNSSNDDSSKSK
jgi:hypothetical protein